LLVARVLGQSREPVPPARMIPFCTITVYYARVTLPPAAHGEPPVQRAGLVDFHNHILPGVDDGARDAGETRAALRAMYAAGVRLVIATPHFAASMTVGDKGAAYRARIAQALDDARSVAAMEAPDLRVELGAEIMLDDADANLSDPSSRLAGTRFALVEFSLFGAPPTATELLSGLSARGWQPVLAHPERYGGSSHSTLEEWHGAGALLQVNAGSLLGDYGPHARRTAWALLRAGLVHYVCSDYHARGTFRLGAALDAIEKMRRPEPDASAWRRTRYCSAVTRCRSTCHR
jgi:protein-tyrosine phosphatase